MSESEIGLGTINQRQILQFIKDFYDEDDRVLAILLFGSLSRGNWDRYSDLDLDIVLADDAEIDARAELENLCAAIKESFGYEALVIADIEEGDVVLGNLVQFSIRYHILSDTKPAILDTMRIISGSLTLEEIRAAANHDYDEEPAQLVDLVNQCLRYTLELHNAIQRQRVWMAMEMLHCIRGVLISMATVSHGANRPIHFLDSQASPELRRHLAALSPPANLGALEEGFRTTLSIVANHLDSFTAGGYQLTASQKQILSMISSQASATQEK